MNGILFIDKPEGPTSHDVVSRVRRVLNTKRVGHTGTLDPFATGVLVLLVGKATRLAKFLDTNEKEYHATLRFGFETDTGDRTGKRKAENGKWKMENTPAVLTEKDWEEVFSHFRGEIEQVPPMYSAKKIDGQKLYELARHGAHIERKPVKIHIKQLELLDNEIRDPHSEICIRVVCSAGTYIRTLAEDIGRKTGLRAHLTELRRTRAGRFTIEQSVSLREFEDAASPEKVLMPMVTAVEHLPIVMLTADRVRRTLDGMSTRVPELDLEDRSDVRMLDEAGNLVAIGSFDVAENSVRPKIVLV